MSKEIALENVRLQTSPRWGHTEYSLEYHKQYLARKTGLKENDPKLMEKAYDLFGFNFLWSTNEGLVNWETAGRTTSMGHAAYATDGSDKQEPLKCPFHSEKDVWAFDAVKEYGLPDFKEQVRAYEESVAHARKMFPGQITSGGYYKTLVSGAIAAFGWDMLLLGTSDPAKMEKVFDSFFKRTLFYMEAWAQTSAEVIIQHDDFVWTSGAFMHPEIYRKVIIPRYAELWKPLHAANKKVLFCSDGNIMEFAGDVANAGADGFIFEPCNDFDYMAKNFGKTKCLVGSFVDCRDLTFNRWEKVREDIDKSLGCLADCKGAIFAVGNHLPSNIPDAMLDQYFEYLLPRLDR